MPRPSRRVIAALSALLLCLSACGERRATGPDTPAVPAAAAPPSAVALDTPKRAVRKPTAAPGVAPNLTQIEVESTPEQYYVLFVRPDLSSDREIPVSITRGQPGKTVLTDGRERLPAAHMRVAVFSVDRPGDVDGDGVDDLTELDHRATMNPLNAAPPIAFEDGAVIVADRAAFEALSYRGEELTPGSHLADLEFVKFYLLGVDTPTPHVYFENSVTHRSHRTFAKVLGVPYGINPGELRGELVYHRNVVAPDGTLGVYRFEFEALDAHPFASVRLAYELLASSMPFLTDNLMYYPMPTWALPRYEREKALYDASRVPVLLDADVHGDDDYAALNPAVGYGLLREMSLEDRPGPRDVVIYRALPNDLPRVAGVLTTVPQTPLSHVNLRAVQDGVPNAFVRDALADPRVSRLIGHYVRFTVDASGFTLAPASLAEVEAHHAARRPARAQVPVRDLSVRTITPLTAIGFADARAFGVKAANLATLAKIGLPAGTVPDGLAVPFSFYDEFMKYNGFYDRVTALLADPRFVADPSVQERQLAALRDAIEAASFPPESMRALDRAQGWFGAGASIRCRSSTNNEDLPDFNGAGLYDSFTQHPDEGHLSKCIKQVYASLWNLRAFTEREFYRVDHLFTAMGVVLHPSYDDELVNGVAVAADPLRDNTEDYYVNSQVGEDLVTNPEALSMPEEVLLHPGGGCTVIRRSNRVGPDETLMNPDRARQLRAALETIDSAFRREYGVGPDRRFAIEVEFKITRDGRLAVKQARPWFFG